MQILKVEKEDIKIIFEIDKNNFTYDSYNIDTLNNYISDKNILFLKIVENNEIIAYSIVLFTKPEAELLKICVENQYRNRGFAKLLLDYNIEYLKNINFENIFLEVRSDNNIAKELYEKSGFIKYNERKNYYKNPNSDAFLYKISLKSI